MSILAPLDFLFYNAKGKYACMVFLCHHRRSTHMGLRIFYEAMMICGNKNFSFSFINAMLM
jgi:hypothetical protein